MAFDDVDGRHYLDIIYQVCNRCRCHVDVIDVDVTKGGRREEGEEPVRKDPIEPITITITNTITTFNRLKSIKYRVWRMRGLMRDGTAEPISRDQILRREPGQGKKNVSLFSRPRVYKRVATRPDG